MLMGGPQHLTKHVSYCIWSLSVPDPEIRAQQDERDRRNNTLTEGQRNPAVAFAEAQPPMTTHHRCLPLTTTDRNANDPFEDEDVHAPETPQASSQAPHAHSDEPIVHQTEPIRPPTILPPTDDHNATNTNTIGAIHADDLAKHAKVRMIQIEAEH